MKFKFLIILLLCNFLLFSENVHPGFTISREDLIKILETENENTRRQIMGSPNLFLSYISRILKNDIIDLTLVDKNNRLTENYIPVNMVNLNDYNLHTRYREMLFCEYALDDFVKMSEAADKDGIEIFIASTYRSYEFQDQIFNNMKNYHGEEKAATIVAYPGASQHQLGTGVDFGSIKPSYAYTDAGIWLLENSWKYGFTISYPKGKEELTTYMWEPWHYRYIGHPATALQRKYFNNIQHLFLVFWNKYRGFFKENHIQ